MENFPYANFFFFFLNSVSFQKLPNLEADRYHGKNIYGKSINDNQLLGFSGILQKNLHEFSFFKNNWKTQYKFFTGDLLNKVRISISLNSTVPFDAHTSYNDNDVNIRSKSNNLMCKT